MELIDASLRLRMKTKRVCYEDLEDLPENCFCLAFLTYQGKTYIDDHTEKEAVIFTSDCMSVYDDEGWAEAKFITTKKEADEFGEWLKEDDMYLNTEIDKLISLTKRVLSMAKSHLQKV
jgi:hypothetical protein